jgi:1,4-alpha-glucan branching enzyme
VHGKSSLINKMPGSDEQKFAGVRAFMCYMMAHPGKKLIFMGTEFGQRSEWNYEKGLEWSLLEYIPHQQLQLFFKDLNHFYLDTSPLWECDFTWEGFSWISSDDYNQSVIAFRRIDKSGNEVLIVCNFQQEKREGYTIGVPVGGIYAEIFSSDSLVYGGSGITNGNNIHSDKKPIHGCEQSINLTLPPMSVLFLKCRRRKAKKLLAPAALVAAIETGKKNTTKL